MRTFPTVALKQSLAYTHARIAIGTTANAFLGIEDANGMHTTASFGVPHMSASSGVPHSYGHAGQVMEYLRMTAFCRKVASRRATALCDGCCFHNSRRHVFTGLLWAKAAAIKPRQRKN